MTDLKSLSWSNGR